MEDFIDLSFFGVVFAGAHGAEVSQKVIQILFRQVRVGGHVAVAEEEVGRGDRRDAVAHVSDLVAEFEREHAAEARGVGEVARHLAVEVQILELHRRRDAFGVRRRPDAPAFLAPPPTVGTPSVHVHVLRSAA